MSVESSKERIGHWNLNARERPRFMALIKISEKIAELTKSARKAQGLTMEQFGAALVETLPGVDTSKQAVNHWESGRQPPSYLFLVGIVRSYGDWRYDWAMGCLQALRPGLWGGEGYQLPLQGTEAVSAVSGQPGEDGDQPLADSSLTEKEDEA